MQPVSDLSARVLCSVTGPSRSAARIPEADELSAALRGQICVSPDEDEEEQREASLWVSGKGPVAPIRAD